MARTFGASVHGVHVLAPRTAAGSGRSTRRQVVPTLRSLEELYASDFDGVPLTFEVGTGRPWEGIVGAASREHAGLVVMATRGHERPAEGLMGSNAERVLRNAPCPVLVV
jgi:nucleotide-binding universal stress UspA family protein